MVEWIVNCDRSEAKLPWSNRKYSLGRFKGELRKIVTVLIQINSLPPEHETGVMRT